MHLLDNVMSKLLEFEFKLFASATGVQLRMADFKRCVSNSPFCWMTNFCCCCDSDDFIAKRRLGWRESSSPWLNHVRKPPCHHQSDLKELSARKKYRRPPKVAFLLIRYGWALHAFQDWADQRNRFCKEECPRDLLDKPYSPDEVCDCLQRFAAEARRGDGKPYPAKMLYQILCGLLRHSKEVQPNPPNFCRFKGLPDSDGPDCVFQLDTIGLQTMEESRPSDSSPCCDYACDLSYTT